MKLHALPWRRFAGTAGALVAFAAGIGPDDLVTNVSDWIALAPAIAPPSSEATRWLLVGLGVITALVAFAWPGIRAAWSHLPWTDRVVEGEAHVETIVDVRATGRGVELLDASLAGTATDGDMWRVDVVNRGPAADFALSVQIRGTGEDPYYAPWRLDPTRMERFFPIGDHSHEIVNLARQLPTAGFWTRSIRSFFVAPDIDVFSTSIPKTFAFPRPFGSGSLRMEATVWCRDGDGTRKLLVADLVLTRNGSSPIVELTRVSTPMREGSLPLESKRLSP